MPALDEIPLTQLKGVGNKLAETLAKLDISSVQDLLFHLPYRYEDRTRILPLSTFRPGMQGVFDVVVKSSKVVFGKRRSLEVMVQDSSSISILRFYHFTAAQSKQLSAGVHLRCYGEARLGRTGIEFYHPEYAVHQPGSPLPKQDTLTPVYHLTEGIQQPRLRGLCRQALTWLDRANIEDLLPVSIRQQYQFPDIKSALRYIHAPPTDADQLALMDVRHTYQQRLIFEELLAHHLSLLNLRSRFQANPAVVCTQEQSFELRQQLLSALPFGLTGAQERVISEVGADLSRSYPMLRLVQGDVGSGKTIVAAMAALQALGSGGQVALMAPTEILAEQHFANFQQWLEPMHIKLAWLSGKSKGKKREQVLEEIATGQAQIIIGTHALFQGDVVFKNLVLAIIDEQHRFGVHQRLSLKNKGLSAGHVPHQLIMTATPIPRTLAMSAYADLDTSIIDELPPGRQQIETFVIPDTRREDIVLRVARACESGAQAYWVCTLIEDSESLQCQAAEDTAAWLQSQLKGLVVGLVHGRMKAADKTAIMEHFKEGRIDVLVATTVIEVGVDVPNASLIVIENPERLGLAQLHQLRGRVGRGSTKSYCALMYHPPLSQNGKARLNVMRDSSDGFVIAEKDLEIRGPGEVLGTRQTGLIEFRLADLQRDQKWLPEVKQVAPEVMKNKELMQRLMHRWIGNRHQYGEV